MRRTMLLLTLLFGGVASAEGPPAQPPSGAPSDAERRAFANFDKNPPLVGERAPDFALKTVDGKVVKLSEVVQHGPVVVEFGSFS